MGGKRTEACGRCSVSTVVDAAGSDDGGEADGEAGGIDPFDGERIELGEDELRSVVRHEVLARRVKDRLDEVATRFIFG